MNYSDRHQGKNDDADPRPNSVLLSWYLEYGLRGFFQLYEYFIYIIILYVIIVDQFSSNLTRVPLFKS